MVEEQCSENIDELWTSYQRNRTVEVRNAIAEHYLPLIKIIAGKLAIGLPQHIDRDDLISSGFFGLLDAIDRYDMDRKNKFETYAGVRVRGAMLDYLRAKDWLPVAVRQKIRKYEQTVTALESDLGRAATDSEVAAAMQLTEKEYQGLMTHMGASTLISLEDYLRTDSAETLAPGPAESYEKNELKEILARTIEELPEKEKIVVSLYYYEELTLKEISLILHLSEARISQLHTKAVMRMRGALTKKKNIVL